MDKTKFKRSVLKAYLLIITLFSATAVLTAGAYAFAGETIPPLFVLRLVALYATLFVLTLIRIFVSETRWAKDKPYVLMNIFFMPFYFMATMFWLVVLDPLIRIRELPVYAGIFLLTFTVLQIIVYFKKKGNTDRMNDALNEFLKEHRENEYEE